MKHLIHLSLILGILAISFNSRAQSVGIGTETPNENAILELVAPNSNQGLLVPRMTTAQRTAAAFTSSLSSTDNGLMVYDEDENKFFFWIDDQWVALATGNLDGLPDQSGQSGKILLTDGSSAVWSDLDFTSITNIPADISDGDDINDADADITNELQDLSLVTNTLALSNSSVSVDLIPYLDNTDEQNLDFTTGVISLSGDPDATTIDLSNYDTDALDDFDGAFTSLSSIPAGLSDGDDVNDADADITNELQDLSLATNTLALSNSSTSVDLTPYLDNSDSQDLDFTVGVISISGDPDATSIDLSNYDTDSSDDFDGAFTSLSGVPSGLSDGDDVDDADADATNEFQDLTIAGNTLSMTNSSVDIDLTPFSGTNTDNQTLSISGNDLSISGGNTLDISTINTNLSESEVDAFANNNGYLTAEVDGSISNETNTGISLSGTSIEITDAGGTLSQDLDGTFTTDAELTASDAADGDKSATNEIQDISTDGTAGDISLSDGSSLTLNIDDADASTTNEVNTGMSISGTTIQVTDANSTQGVDIGGTFATDAQLTASDAADGDKSATNEIQDISTDGTAGDISLSDGSSLTLNVDDADASTSNEVNTGMSLSGTTIQVTDANSTQGVDIGGTFATDAQLTASDAADGDKSATNEIQDISTDGTAGDISLSDGSSLTLNVDDADASTSNEVNTGMSLSGTTIQVTDANSTQGVDIGGTFATDAELAAINESQWNTNGTSINYASGNVNIGSGTIPTNLFQLSSTASNSNAALFRIYETDATSDASINFRSGSTNYAVGVDGSANAFKISAFTSVGNTDRLTIDNTGAMGLGASPFAKLHIGSLTSEAVAIRIGHTYTGAASMIGLYNIMANEGTSLKTGVWNAITGTDLNTQSVRGVYNAITPTAGTTYGVHNQLNAAGTGIRYGTYSSVRGEASNTSSIFGTRADMDHDGSGDSYAFYGQLGGTTTGNKYGVFIDAEDYNYFNGHLGIGEQIPDVELAIQSFDISSTLPQIRMTSGAATSDAAISFETGGLGNDFIVGVDATDESFKISDASVLGTNDRVTIDNTGNVGISQSSPSARLDVVGNSELNGQVSGDNFVYTSGNEKSYVYSMSGADFTIGETSLSFPSDFNSFYEVRLAGAASSEFRLRGGSSVTGTLGKMIAPIHLPQGSTITQIQVYGRNSSMANSTSINLISANFSTTSTITAIGSIAPGIGAAGLQVDTSGLNISIDNDNLSYLLQIETEIGVLGITGVKIHYTKSSLD